MAIVKQKSNVQDNLSEHFESEEFKIKVTAKSFELLLDGLYKDKIKAPIQELMSNAWDSHKMAGKEDVPFKVTLPTFLNQTFAVRDYGTSLSHDDIMNLYTTVFDSTKESTNNQVGQFGLGSKSPYAYTDVFTVKAFMDGNVRTYVAAMSNERIPTITFVSEETSDEPQGLEVSFPTKSSDIRAFEKAFRRVVLGFDVVPEVNLETPLSKPFISSPNNSFKIFKNVPHEEKGVFIKQGCVIYPIDRYKLSIGNHIAYGSLTLLDVPIGTFDVTASRESIVETSEVYAQVSSMIDEGIKSISINIQKYLDEEPTYSDACMLFISLNNIFSISQYVGNYHIYSPYLSDNRYTWNGEPLYGMIEAAIGIKKHESGKWSVEQHSICPTNMVSRKNVVYRMEDQKNIYRQSKALTNFDEAALFVDGVQSESDLKLLKRFCDDLGITLTNVQDLPPVPKPPRSTIKVKRKSSKLPYLYNVISGNLVKQELPDKKDYVWVEIDKYTGGAVLDDSGKPLPNYRMLRIFEDIKEWMDKFYILTYDEGCRFDRPQLYVVTSNNKKYYDLPEDRNFFKMFKEFIDENQELLIQINMLMKLIRSSYIDVNNVYDIFKKMYKEDLVHEISLGLTDDTFPIYRHRQFMEASGRIYYMVDKSGYDDFSTVAKEKIYNLTRKYPIIFNDPTTSDIKRYINLVDKANKEKK